MGPISSIGQSSTPRPFPTRAPEAGAATGTQSAGHGTTNRTSDALAQVSDLLSGLGGNTENNKMLEMLLVLIVLMAMLSDQTSGNGSQGSNASQADPRMNGGVGGGLNSSGGYIQSSISMTSISIQQTSITSTTYLPDASAGGTGSGLDVSA